MSTILHLPWDVHLMPGEAALIPLQFDQDSRFYLCGEETVLSLESMLLVGCMWDRTRVDIDGGRCVWQLLTNPSKKETTSDSEWATVPVFARKKPNPDGSPAGLRYAVDFRGLNKQLCADRYAMPSMDDVLDSLGEASIFSTFDISSGFWGVKVREADTKYLSFHALWKGAWHLWKFLRMPFGLLMATADFSRAYQKILGPTATDSRGLLGWITRIWVDDNVIYSKMKHEHLDHICLVLQRLHANGMCIKPNKSMWYTTELPFLGQLVIA